MWDTVSMVALSGMFITHVCLHVLYSYRIKQYEKKIETLINIGERDSVNKTLSDIMAFTKLSARIQVNRTTNTSALVAIGIAIGALAFVMLNMETAESGWIFLLLVPLPACMLTYRLYAIRSKSAREVQPLWSGH